MDPKRISEFDQPPFQMPPFEGRNIVIFSDGTGQAGGITFDEYRSNVYKLYRATRCGPDTDIDPDQQLAYYDPGLGSPLSGEGIRFGLLRKFYNLISSATGLGITHNIVDCYAALVRLYRPGDRIFLFGFSRGAYTVRCLGGVLGLCGIPTRMPGDKPMLRDVTTARSIAREAVRRVYRHGSGTDDKGQATDARKQEMTKQRKALGLQFRERYRSSGPDGGPNVVPHFIGVWDTVAAVGLSPPAWRVLVAIVLVVLLGAAAGMAKFATGTFGWSFITWLVASLAILLLTVTGLYYLLRTKFVTDLPGYRWYQTLHLMSFKMAFFDRSLNPRVRYARHALALDEHRADFDRVPWVNDADPPPRSEADGPWFEQMWFAGNHSDIGGSYPENESRLSDIALGWLASEAVRAGLLIDRRYLKLFGRHTGQQHDECREGIRWSRFRFKWREANRTIDENAPIHPSVKERFKEELLLIYDEEKPYRPRLLRQHIDFRKFYEKS
jgi:uncharacterized protein (DUF2235 family)